MVVLGETKQKVAFFFVSEVSVKTMFSTRSIVVKLG